MTTAANDAYNPTEFWTERGKTYMRDFLDHKNADHVRQEKHLIKYLDSLNPSICKGSILEVGAGFGRLSRLVLEHYHTRIEKYVLLDLSVEQLRNARIYLNDELGKSILRTVKLEFIHDDIIKYNSLEKYDLVLAFETLLHVKPENIQTVVNKLVSLSKNDVISIDWYEDEPAKIPRPLAPWNFAHDYPDLYLKAGLDYVTRKPIRDAGAPKVSPETSLFHARRIVS